MEHQGHSNWNSSLHHHTFTTSASSPSFRVEVDMGTEEFANGKVVYTSVEDENRTCVESLKDDAHYRFQCRCGCGATFAGYGKDIRAAARVGGDITAFPADPQIGDQWYNERTNTIYVCTDRKGNCPVWSEVKAASTINVEPAKLDATWSLEEAVDLMDDWCEDEEIVVETEKREEAAEKPRPYVSDRYLKKAQFDLSDEEIDVYAEGKDDPLVSLGVDLSRRQPPAIADLVYSLVTGQGPMTLLEYQDKEIKVEGEKKRILCGLCRTKKGKYVKVPLADLAVEYPGREVAGGSFWRTALMMLAAGIGGSVIGLTGWQLLF